ncbi:Meiotic recombination protein SPO11-2 [Chlorella vulgaris]
MADRLLAEIFGRGGAASQQHDSQVDDDEGAAAWDEAEAPGSGDDEGEPASAPALDMDASAAEVCRRIVSASLWFVSQLCNGQVPSIELVQREASNRALMEVCGVGENEAEQGDAEGRSGSGGAYVLRMQQHTQTRSLLGRHPESGEAVARLFVLLEAVHQNLLAGVSATQRELWYTLKTLEVKAQVVAVVFRCPRDVGEAIQDAVSMLRVPRSALGVTASSKGLVAGRLAVHDTRAGATTDCASLGVSGVPIPGDIAHITRHLAYQSDALLVLVVEKDAVFQRLAQQRFFDRVPCVLVTGKGVPDLATRAFLSCLSACFPGLPLLGLVDWNPSGANILCIYRFGSHRMGLESPHYALPTLGWLGARSSQLQQADAGAFQELTGRDRTMATNLSHTLQHACPGWAAELHQMLDSGSKAEMEALDTVAGGTDLADLLIHCLEQGDCI